MKDTLDELQKSASGGFPKYLKTLNSAKLTFETEPHVIANFIKKILRDMEEPLCQYKNIKDFIQIGQMKQDDKA